MSCLSLNCLLLSITSLLIAGGVGETKQDPLYRASLPRLYPYKENTKENNGYDPLVSFLRTCTVRATQPLYCLDRSTVHVFEAVRDECTSIHSAKENSASIGSQQFVLPSLSTITIPPTATLTLPEHSSVPPLLTLPEHPFHRDSRCRNILMFHRD
uniref:Uncharacterized protein n=1 Tax=Timema genevievae TaxID=629358 RepID=A0A7R9PLU7_TIMGE|nr:unnamed protein product [Timema genevievae]